MVSGLIRPGGKRFLFFFLLCCCCCCLFCLASSSSSLQFPFIWARGLVQPSQDYFYYRKMCLVCLIRVLRQQHQISPFVFFLVDSLSLPTSQFPHPAFSIYRDRAICSDCKNARYTIFFSVLIKAPFPSLFLSSVRIGCRNKRKI